MLLLGSPSARVESLLQPWEKAVSCKSTDRLNLVN